MNYQGIPPQKKEDKKERKLKGKTETMITVHRDGMNSSAVLLKSIYLCVEAVTETEC